MGTTPALAVDAPTERPQRDAYGICEDGICEIRRSDDIAVEKARLAGQRDVFFTDDEDPDGRVACVEGRRCRVIADGVTRKDLVRKHRPRHVIIGLVDATPVGGRVVVNQRSTMVCPNGASKSLELPLPKLAGRVETSVRDGVMTGDGLDDIVDSLDMSRVFATIPKGKVELDGLARGDQAALQGVQVVRLGPGVYAADLSILGDGALAAEVAWRLGMRDQDAFTGVMVAHVNVGGLICTITRRFDGTREFTQETSGLEPTDEIAPEPSFSP